MRQSVILLRERYEFNVGQQQDTGDYLLLVKETEEKRERERETNRRD